MVTEYASDVVSESLTRVLDRLEHVRRSGAGWSALCPAHEDRSPSLSVSDGETTDVVVHCHAGCKPEDVVAALGLTMADLVGQPRLIASYPYYDADGRLLYTVQRWSPKTFRVHPGLPPARQRVLFGQSWIAHARASGQTLYVVEGEKDAVTLLDRGIPATTAVGGAGKWLPHYAEQLAGCHVIVVADDDVLGHRHACTVAAALTGVAASVALMRPGYGKDITDMLAAGLDLDRLEPLAQPGPLPVIEPATLQRKRVAWVWPQYFPAGKISTIEGDPGGGKSTLTIDLVARWTTGVPMPDGITHGGPYTCLMISAEDDPEDTILPRLHSAGADLTRVALLASGADPETPFNLGVDYDALQQTIIQRRIDIVTLDPLAAFLPSDSDSHSDASIRRALYPLHLLARRLGVAVIAVRHLSKSATKAIHAGNGSIGIIAAARAAFMVGISPDDPGTRIMAPIKCNLSAPPPTLMYAIEYDPANDVGRIRWGGSLDMTAQDVLDGERVTDERSAKDDARDYLRELLVVPMTWREITARSARDKGPSEITMRRVRKEIATKVVNPVLAAGQRCDGTYWVRTDLLDAFTLGQRPQPTLSAPDTPEVPAATSTPPPTTDEERELDLMARPMTCDICAAPGLRFAAPHWAVRCLAHDPRRWHEN